MKFKHYLLLEATSSNLTWQTPNIDDEAGEYFENPYTKNFLKKKGIEFKNKKELKNAFNKGVHTHISKEELLKNNHNMTLDPSEFEKELADPEYRKSYNSMEQAVKSGKPVTLPSPIILKLKGGLHYGFAGNRRINLALRNNLPLKAHIVDLSGHSSQPQVTNEESPQITKVPPFTNNNRPVDKPEPFKK